MKKSTRRLILIIVIAALILLIGYLVAAKIKSDKVRLSSPVRSYSQTSAPEWDCQCGIQCTFCRISCVLCANPFSEGYPGFGWCLSHSLYCLNPFNSIYIDCPSCEDV